MLLPQASDLVSRLIREYGKGTYTHLEVVSSLVHAAASHPVAELAASMPKEWLEAVKKTTLNPPRFPGERIHIGGVTLRAGAEDEHERWKVAREKESYEAIWLWHGYFTRGTGELGREVESDGVL